MIAITGISDRDRPEWMIAINGIRTVDESLGIDRLLKFNANKTRTHSLFRQRSILYELIPNTPKQRLVPLIRAFAQAVSKASESNGLFAQAE